MLEPFADRLLQKPRQQVEHRLCLEQQRRLEQVEEALLVVVQRQMHLLRLVDSQDFWLALAELLAGRQLGWLA